MPLAQVVCPHCEQPVELNVTSVTRARPCPKCGTQVMLQFMQRSGKVKRKALLVTAKPGGLDFASMHDDGPTYEPQPLPGDALERMKMDPELHEFRRRFYYGIGAVAATVAIASAVHFVMGNRSAEKVNPLDASRREQTEHYVSSSSLKTSRLETVKRPDKRAEKLDFMGVEAPPHVQQQAKQTAAAAKRIQMVGSTLTPKAGPSASGLGSAGTQASARAPSGGIPSLPNDLYRVPRIKAEQAGAHNLTKAKAVLTTFLHAGSVEDRVPLVLGGAMLENRMRAWYETRSAGAVAFQRIQSSAVVADGTASEHEIVLAGGVRRRATVVQAEGGYYVDWPSFVFLSDMEWEAFMKSQPTSPTLFRVTAERAGHFGGGFQDSRLLTCVKLGNPAEPSAPPIFAYAQKSSSLGRDLEYWLQQGGESALPLTLRLKFPPAAESDNQVWITELVSPSWVTKGPHAVAEARVAGTRN